MVEQNSACLKLLLCFKAFIIIHYSLISSSIGIFRIPIQIKHANDTEFWLMLFGVYSADGYFPMLAAW